VASDDCRAEDLVLLTRASACGRSFCSSRLNELVRLGRMSFCCCCCGAMVRACSKVIVCMYGLGGSRKCAPPATVVRVVQLTRDKISLSISGMTALVTKQCNGASEQMQKEYSCSLGAAVTPSACARLGHEVTGSCLHTQANRKSLYHQRAEKG
jgi:hypothetical protein